MVQHMDALLSTYRAFHPHVENLRLPNGMQGNFIVAKGPAEI